MLRKLKIGKDIWTIKRVPKDPLKENYGGVIEQQKTIVIFDHPDHSDPVQLFCTIAHEVIHARNKRLSEKAVCETEAALMEVAYSIFTEKGK